MLKIFFAVVFLYALTSSFASATTVKSIEHTIFNNSEPAEIIFKRDVGSIGLDCPLRVLLNGGFAGELNKDGESFKTNIKPGKHLISASYRCTGISHTFTRIEDYTMRPKELVIQSGGMAEYILTTMCVKNKTQCTKESNPVIVPSVAVANESSSRATRLSFENTYGHPVEVSFKYTFEDKVFNSPKYIVNAPEIDIYPRSQGSYILFAKPQGKSVEEEILNLNPGQESTFRFLVLKIEVTNRIWTRLTSNERRYLESRNVVEILPDELYGEIIDSQGQNLSDPGSSMGSYLGAEYARRKFNDKYFQEQLSRIQKGQNIQAYDSAGSMRKQLLGALTASSLDRPAESKFKFRYSIKTGNQRVIARDIITDEPFRHPRGACVRTTDFEPLNQELCANDIKAFRETYLTENIQNVIPPSQNRQENATTKPLAVRLKEVKELFDQNLIDKSQYDEQVRRILNTQ
jgi:hypothetical protein